MSVTWFAIKSIFLTFIVVSVLQLRWGQENKTLEIHLVQWMKSLSASKRIQNIAQGGKSLTTDVIKEFTTEDGSKILVTASNPINKDEKKKDQKNKLMLKDSGVVKKILDGFKLEIADLSESAKESLKAEVYKDIESELKDKKTKRSRTASETSSKKNKRLN